MANEPTRPLPKRERHYRIAALLVCLGLLAAVALGAVGMTGPGVLTPESAFLVGGLAVAVVAAGLVYIFLT